MTVSDLQALRSSAAGGDRDAAFRLAIDLAMSTGDSASWGEAVNWLGRAAAAGHADAQQQLDLLAGWTEAYDWPVVPDPRPLCQAPVVLALDAFLPQPMCEWLIRRGGGVVRPARVFDEATGEGRIDPGRSNSSGALSGSEADMIVAFARRRIAQASGVPTIAMEPTQILSYDVGQTFDWHVDFLDPKVAGFGADLARRGQRIATCLIYLNHDFTGGETSFSAIDLNHRGRTGDAILWSNVLPDGDVDRETVHAGLPPQSGRKWVLSQWIRDRAPRAA